MSVTIFKSACLCVPMFVVFACTLHVPSEPEDRRPGAQLENEGNEGDDGKGDIGGNGDEKNIGDGGKGGNSNASSKNKDACLKLRRCSLS